ncbi:hypothetical protein GQ457_05G021520 [Hibiscus cannabinus]
MHGLPEWTQRDDETRTAQLDSSNTILAQISALTNFVKNMQKQSNIQEVKIDAFMDRTEMRMQNQGAALKSLEVGHISQVFNTRPLGGFSSDTEFAKGATHEQ